MKIYGHEIDPEVESDGTPLNLSETCIAVESEQELVKIRDFLNYCLREIRSGKLTGVGGGHRHFSFFSEQLPNEPDIIVTIEE